MKNDNQQQAKAHISMIIPKDPFSFERIFPEFQKVKIENSEDQPNTHPPRVVISGRQELTIQGLPAVSAQSADDSDIERLLNYHKERFLFGYPRLDKAKADSSRMVNKRDQEFSLCMTYLFQPNKAGEQKITFHVSYAEGNSPATYRREKPCDRAPHADRTELKEIRRQMKKEAFFYVHGADTFVFREALEETECSIVINYCLKCIRDSLQSYLDFICYEAQRRGTLPNYWGNRIQFPSKAELKQNSPLWKPQPDTPTDDISSCSFRLLLSIVTGKNVTPPQTQI